MLQFLQLSHIQHLMTLIIKFTIPTNFSFTSESQVQNPQQDPQTTQPMKQQQPNIQLENFSTQAK